MNVTLNKTDEVNAVITVEVVKADYVNEVENSLKDLRKNAVIPGFRKGMVPPAFLRQKYGLSILVEEINKLVSRSLTDYIKENSPDILGEPLPAEDQAQIDFDKQEDFVFTFDVGLSPKIDVKLTKDDVMPFYHIQVNEEMINRQIESYKTRYGSNEPVETFEDKDMLRGCLVELNENKEPKENGITNESAVFMPAYMKNEEEKAKFLNAKPQSRVIFNPHSAYDGVEAELASLFNIKKEELKNHTGDFSFEITEITRYKEAELNQELFDKVFGEGTVDSEDTFRKKIKGDLALQLAPEGDYKFVLDARKLLQEKATDMQLPDAFLKRWLLTSDSKRTAESIEEEYPKIVEDLKFHLIREHLIEANDITIEDGELLKYAKQATRAQFAQYGMYEIPDDLLDKYAEDMLKKKETYRTLGDKIFEDKLIKILKGQVTLKTKKISFDNFQKLFDK